MLQYAVSPKPWCSRWSQICYERAKSNGSCADKLKQDGATALPRCVAIKESAPAMFMGYPLRLPHRKTSPAEAIRHRNEQHSCTTDLLKSTYAVRNGAAPAQKSFDAWLSPSNRLRHSVAVWKESHMKVRKSHEHNTSTRHCTRDYSGLVATKTAQCRCTEHPTQQSQTDGKRYR